MDEAIQMKQQQERFIDVRFVSSVINDTNSFR
jgi:hypothetical protein